ncbi:hypothetical protein LXL04_038435 [Taraxacum kok-saghyz]
MKITFSITFCKLCANRSLCEIDILNENNLCDYILREDSVSATTIFTILDLHLPLQRVQQDLLASWLNSPQLKAELEYLAEFYNTVSAHKRLVARLLQCLKTKTLNRRANPKIDIRRFHFQFPNPPSRFLLSSTSVTTHTHRRTKSVTADLRSSTSRCHRPSLNASPIRRRPSTIAAITITDCLLVAIAIIEFDLRFKLHDFGFKSSRAELERLVYFTSSSSSLKYRLVVSSSRASSSSMFHELELELSSTRLDSARLHP